MTPSGLRTCDDRGAVSSPLCRGPRPRMRRRRRRPSRCHRSSRGRRGAYQIVLAGVGSTDDMGAQMATAALNGEVADSARGGMDQAPLPGGEAGGVDQRLTTGHASSKTGHSLSKTCSSAPAILRGACPITDPPGGVRNARPCLWRAYIALATGDRFDLHRVPARRTNQ